MAGLSLTLPISFSDSSLPKLPIVLASDSFNRANTAQGVLGTTDSALGGNPVAWEADANISIGANRWTATGQGTNRNSRIDVGTANHKVTATWYAGEGGILARWVDASNHYRLLMQNTGLGLYRVLGGTNVAVWGPGPILAPGDTFSLSVQGAEVTVQHKGVTVKTWTDPTPVTGGTRAGLRSAFTQETSFDSLMVTNL